jgi:hypothetical protein
MALALNNAQGELHPLEVGLHALGFIEAGGTIRDYAKRAGAAENTLADRVKAARVATVTNVRDREHWLHLSIIHTAPSWLWHALVSAMLDKGCRPGGGCCDA